ncbi:MAG: hypothetical protein HY721_20210 [Planctomycetes bacterium]|nr:hypothetical protein [Planctomycetota bacterium]
MSRTAATHVLTARAPRFAAALLALWVAGSSCEPDALRPSSVEEGQARAAAEAPAAPARRAISKEDEEKAAALAEVARDAARPREERRAAAIERARLLGFEAPPELFAPLEPARRIEIPAPAGAPAADTVEPGRFLLSYDVDYEGGARASGRVACRVQVSGEALEAEPEDPHLGKIQGTLRGGKVAAEMTEGEARFRLEGQVTGPGRLAGALSGGHEAKGIRVREGRWSLERIP